jgi:hypothetical protein
MRPAGDKGHLSHSLRTLETGSLSVIGRSSDKADYLMLTPEGQTWARKFTRSCG